MSLELIQIKLKLRHKGHSQCLSLGCIHPKLHYDAYTTRYKLIVTYSLPNTKPSYHGFSLSLKLNTVMAGDRISKDRFVNKPMLARGR